MLLNKNNVVIPFLCSMFALLLTLISSNGYGDNRQTSTTGFVAAVAVEVDEKGHPMLAEYDSKGFFVKDVGHLGLGRFEDVTVYPAASWRAFEDLHQVLIDQNLAITNGATLMSTDAYESRNFQTRSDTPQAVKKPKLRDNTRSVFVVSEDRMLTADPGKENFILAEYPIALTPKKPIDKNAVSLLIDKDGNVEYASRYDISLKAAVYKEDGRDSNKGEERLWQPIPGIKVTAGDPEFNLFPIGLAYTQLDGRYSMSYILPPCPGFEYQMDVPIIATLDIDNFNPKATSQGYITAQRSTSKQCVGFGDTSLGASPTATAAQLNAQTIVATLAVPTLNFDITFSTMQLSAIGKFSANPEWPEVKLTDKTIYTENSQLNPLQAKDYKFDFNLDGTLDTAVISPQNSKQIDIFYSPKTEFNQLGQRNTPDITREADFELLSQLEHQGLLSEIRKEDLEETDIYIYRRSTGQLLSAIKGLVKEQEIEGPVSGGNVANPEGRLSYRGVHENETIATFGFTSMLVGAVSDDVISSLSNSDLTDKTDRRPWITSQDKKGGGFTKGNKPDGLRPGEVIQVIAINRATGYIGTQDIVTQPSGATLNLPTPIEMGPPNLKIIATREFIDNNELTGSKDKIVNLIGNEGAGLTSDTYIKIQSIWLDQNGDTLPDDLPGYTGRLAISKGGQTQARNPDIAANFPINPGYDTKLVKLNNAADLDLQHFYLQVVGGNINDRPTFESPGAGSGKLQTRPKKYVPLLVPIFDEPSTRSAEEALAIARIEKVGNLPDEVEPVYRWAYRPEMQFSVYTLTKQKLKIERGDGGKREIDLTKTDEDLLGFLIEEDLNFVKLLYDLGAPASDPLEQFSGDDELIFSIGASEAVAEIKSGGMVHFESTKHLDMLASGDLLTIRLYQNNDSANVLWDYNISGIYAFYKIPHVERSLKKTKDLKNNNKEFRILGGTRTKFTYYPEPGEEGITNYSWSFSPAGKFTKDFEFNPMPAPMIDTDKQSVYWEPNEWKTDHDITGKLTITLPSGEKRDKSFKVTSRILGPSLPADEREGSDVAILEELFWHLGLSSQYGFPGKDGTRINTIVPEGSIILAKPRDKFSKGHDFAEKGDPRSQRAPGSHEKMIRRFQGRFEAIGTGAQKLVSAGEPPGNATGELSGMSNMTNLEKLHNDYLEAYDANNRRPNIQIIRRSTGQYQLVNGDQQWITNALNEWGNAYSDATHSSTLDQGETVTRQTLLLAWLQKEGGSHWGEGDPDTDFRLTEGGADEFASMGFNQILFQYSYGANKVCDMKTLNMFDPDENIRGFAKFLTFPSASAGCDNNFDLIFNRNLFAQTYDNTVVGASKPKLQGLFRTPGRYQPIASNGIHTDDAYEKLSKAIMGYNAGKDNLNDGAWVDLLVELEPTTQNKESNSRNRPFKGVQYSIDIKKAAGMRSRTYTFEWTVDQAQATIYPNYNLGDTFCFNYSENDWYGNTWWNVLRDEVLSGNRAEVDCTTGS